MTSPTDTTGLPDRFVSLDAFRGLTIAGMILVNTPGSWSYVYPPLRHAEWHGATPTDLVFPFFLFIVGTAMAFSFSKFNYKLSGDLARKIFFRVLLIFAIGLFLNWFPFRRALGDLRILGVLQRIALAYGVAAVLCSSFTRNGLVWISGVILVGYWALLVAFGGADPFSLETNFARTIDLWVLGESHVYKGFGIPFDPEGLLSTLPAAVTVVIGFLTGLAIRSGRDSQSVLVPIFLSGTGLIFVGLAWDLFFPINKPLWTSSYVLYTAGVAQCLLAWFIWLIDIEERRKWVQPFVVFGMNPLFAYVLSILWVKVIIYLIRIPSEDGTTSGYSWLFRSVFEPVAGSMMGSLLFAIAHVLAIWVICQLLYKRRWFIKI